MIITIDGPVATGKSTIAKKLAQAVGYIYYDTGAMYRAVAYAALQKKMDVNDLNALDELLKDFDFRIKFNRGERGYYLNGQDITDAIRKEEVSNFASKVSAIPQVREKLVSLQRQLAQGLNAVFEGRDMGTVVFPNANLKIFLTGRDDIRAKRRYDELRGKYPEETKDLTLEQVLKDLHERDEYDMNRQYSPLKKADDAFEIDTSDLTVDEIVFKILECRDLAAQAAKKKKQ
jgi:cytidylate kinase